MGGLMGEWQFTGDELDLLGLRPGEVLGPGVVGLATDDDEEPA